MLIYFNISLIDTYPFKQWVKGILYNFTAHFVRGSVASAPSVFTDLLNYITQRNNFEVGSNFALLRKL